MRVRYREIGKVPDQVGGTESFGGALQRTGEVKNDPDKEKRQRVTSGNFTPGTPESHNEIGGAGNYRNDHTGATNNGYRLQRPRNGAEYKMVRTDYGIKKDLRPESQNSEAVRINWLIELLRQEIINQTQREKH